MAESVRRPRRRALAPNLSTVHLVTDSATVTIDSLGFWFKRLSELACPYCKFVGTLYVAHERFGIVITCSRTESLHDPCEFEDEVHFRDPAR